MWSWIFFLALWPTFLEVLASFCQRFLPCVLGQWLQQLQTSSVLITQYLRGGDTLFPASKAQKLSKTLIMYLPLNQSIGQEDYIACGHLDHMPHSRWWWRGPIRNSFTKKRGGSPNKNGSIVTIMNQNRYICAYVCDNWITVPYTRD